MIEPGNLLRDIPVDLPEELVQILHTVPGMTIERVVSYGHSSPLGFWYDQQQDEWVLLIAGSARLLIEGQPTVMLTPGSFLNIRAHQRHRVDWTDPDQPTIWLAVHYGARTGDG